MLWNVFIWQWQSFWHLCYCINRRREQEGCLYNEFVDETDWIMSQHMMWNSWSLPPLSVPWPGQASVVVWAAPALSGSPGQAGPQHCDHNTTDAAAAFFLHFHQLCFYQMYKEQWKLSKQRDTRVDCSPFSGEIASKLKLLAGFVYTRLPQVVIKIVLASLHYYYHKCYQSTLNLSYHQVY